MFKRLLLDYGHGGTDPVTGAYMTPGAKQYRFLDYDDLWIGEGNTNREQAWRLAVLMMAAGVEVHDVVAGKLLVSPPTSAADLEQRDVPLGQRVRYANRFDPSTSLLVSLHGNAIGNELRGSSKPANGASVYTSPGRTRSDDVATALHNALDEALKPLGRRALRGDWADGDVDFEAPFYVLKHTRMPAVLGEVLFFTNIDDARVLLSCEGQQAIATGYFNGLRPLFG